MDGTTYTWETLATVGGATAVTLLIVQFAKIPLDKVWKIPTRWLVYAISLVVMLLSQTFTVGITLADLPLAICNAFVVSAAAMGAYEATFAKLNEPKEP